MTTCALCRRPDPSGAHACAACQADLHTALTELRHQLPLLRATLAPGASPRAGTSAGGRATAPLPVRLDVLSLLGPAAPGVVRGQPADQHGPAPLVGVLRDWAYAVADEQHKRRPAAVPATAAETYTDYLRDHLPWICHRDWVHEFAGEVRELLGVVRGITCSEPRTRVLPAPCPCGAFGLTQRDWSDVVACSVCDRHMTRQAYDQHAATVLPPLYRLSVLIVAAHAGDPQEGPPPAADLRGYRTHDR